MAIYHLSTHTHSRNKGHSAVSAAAYRSGEKLYDERLGETYNWQAYRKSHGEVMDSQIFLPANADKKYMDRGLLWNAAESSEKTKAGEYKKTAAIAREIECSLPHEMKHEQRKILARSHAEFLVKRYGTAVDMNIHAPHPEGSEKNYHVHFLMTTRTLDPTGFGNKTELELDGKTKKERGYANGKSQIKEMRENWANELNNEMERGGFSDRVDHRSYEDQGINKIPSKHMGTTATEMERKGIETTRGNQNREIESWNRELADLQWQESIIEAAIEKEKQRIAIEKQKQKEIQQQQLKDKQRNKPESIKQHNSVAEELDKQRVIEAKEIAEKKRVERLYGEHNRSISEAQKNQSKKQTEETLEQNKSIKTAFEKGTAVNDNTQSLQDKKIDQDYGGFER